MQYRPDDKKMQKKKERKKKGHDNLYFMSANIYHCVSKKQLISWISNQLSQVSHKILLRTMKDN